MVDGSNESIYHPNDDLDPNSSTGTLLQKSLEKVEVCEDWGLRPCPLELILDGGLEGIIPLFHSLTIPFPPFSYATKRKEYRDHKPQFERFEFVAICSCVQSH